MNIELHIIQNFAPSNLNRDDTNNPKDCTFGGVRRARISSQAFKRAIRREPIFAESTGVPPAVRTRLLVTERFQPALEQAGVSPEDAQLVAVALAEAIGNKVEGDNLHTSVLLYLSDQEVNDLVARTLGQWEDIYAGLVQEKPDTRLLDKLVKDYVTAIRGRASAPDIAMFGRMLAEHPDFNIDAACQVAHAISTHQVSMEMDFFTAVDDLQQDGETGSAHMGMTGFNSATFYRYARIDWDQLVQNLNGNVEMARRTVAGFLRAAVRAIPTGKQNTFAAHNPPSFLMAVVRADGMCWSLANAFEKPVYPGYQRGLIAESVGRLDEYWARLQQVYGSDQQHVTVLAIEPDLPLDYLAAYTVDNVETWVASTLDALPRAEESLS